MSAARHWRSDAACREMSGELFFPTAVSGPTYDAQVSAAKAVCATCAVRAECLDEALVRIPEGIAGGMTAEERRRLRRPPVRAKRARGETRSGEREAAGRVLLAAGHPIREVARSCGVSERTAARWAARARAAPTPDVGEGSRGGNRAPLQISPTPNPLAGTRTQEGRQE
jgi:Transcription factor WhiB/Homeodomain-like domain